MLACYIILCTCKLTYSNFSTLYYLHMDHNTSLHSTDNKNINHHAIMPKIIINADDYGYCEQRCEGILQLLQQGKISSTSVIVNTPCIEKMSIKLKNLLHKDNISLQCLTAQNQAKNPIKQKNQRSTKFSIGLHLNFTQFHPCIINEIFTQISIIDPQTKIYKGKQFIYNNLQTIAEDEHLQHFVQCQTRHQIQKFIELFGCKPTHIDGHNHVHIIPCFAESICKIASLYGIYKIRMPLPCQIDSQNNNVSVNQYNKKFIQLAKESKIIYDKNGFIYPDYFIGLSTIGKLISNVKKQIDRIIQITQPQHIENTSVQIMVHPGYKQTNSFTQLKNCQFSQSIEREIQMTTLKSSQFQFLRNVLISYQGLKRNISQKSVLIYSKLLNCSGNLTTSLRLKHIFTSLGYQTYLFDVPEQSGPQHQQMRLSQFIAQFGIKLIVGVNLTRTAGVIYRAVNMKKYSSDANKSTQYAFKIPYVLVIAGTDANITLKQGKQKVLRQINQSIQKCQILISISSEMKNQVQNYLKQCNINKDILLITQSTINQVVRDQINTSIIIPNFNSAVPYIVFPASFRRVKCIQHILPELNTLIQLYNINVFIFGPIIDKQYYQQAQPSLNKVVYLKCIPHNIYINILKNALALINCSQSEGMSCSILQAFAEKIPVIVRQNQGNCQLVKDEVNGFVYRDGKSFIDKFQLLWKDYANFKQKLCGEGYKKLEKQYSFQKQAGLYKQMLDKYINPYIYKLQLEYSEIESKTKQTFMLCVKNVHGISPVNLKIFNKFFIYSQLNKFIPCEKYIGKMIQSQANKLNNNQYCLNILDVGSGSGIFCIYFIAKFMQIKFLSKYILKLKLVFLDIDAQSLNNLTVNLRMLQQLCTTKYNQNIVIQKVTLLHSDMFNELTNQYLKKFDIILANMPQTPFKNPQSRLDKNGGQDGLKLTTILVQDSHKYMRNQNSILVMLYSHMLEHQKFNDLVKDNDGSIQWISQPEIHKIRKDQYEKMEKGLTGLIQERVYNGKTGVKLQYQIFEVPADLRVIQFS